MDAHHRKKVARLRVPVLLAVVVHNSFQQLGVVQKRLMQGGLQLSDDRIVKNASQGLGPRYAVHSPLLVPRHSGRYKNWRNVFRV